MDRAKIIFSGLVQGIGFRYTTLRLAKTIGLKGWVKNLNDGRVEVQAEGSKTAIDQLCTALDGQFGGYIKGKTIEFSQCLGDFRAFEIRD